MNNNKCGSLKQGHMLSSALLEDSFLRNGERGNILKISFLNRRAKLDLYFQTLESSFGSAFPIPPSWRVCCKSVSAKIETVLEYFYFIYLFYFLFIFFYFFINSDERHLILERSSRFTSNLRKLHVFKRRLYDIRTTFRWNNLYFISERHSWKKVEPFQWFV